VIVLAGFALWSPLTIYASDISEGEASSAEVEAEESAHEQAEAARRRVEEEHVIVEIKAAAKREADEVGIEGQTEFKKIAPRDAADMEDVDKGETPQRDSATGEAVDDAADAARHRSEASFEDPETAGEFEPAE